MNKTLNGAALVLLSCITGIASAGNPVDSFNSANAALLPSVAVDRQSGDAASKGPVDALIRMVPGQKKPAEPEPAKPPEPAEQ